MFWLLQTMTAHAATISLPQASSYAHLVDNLHDVLFWFSMFFQVLVTILLVAFVLKYHNSRKGRQTAYILGHHGLESFWTWGTTVLMIGVFIWGYHDYKIFRTPLKDPFEINVVGRQWMWNFEYTNGRKTLNELYLPKDRNIRLVLTSEDVLHSFFLPNMRIKNDVVPGMYVTLEFHTTLAGEHPIYCAEYCGTGHSDMLGKAIVLEQPDFDRWLTTGKLPAGIGGSGVAMASTPSGGAATTALVAPAERGKSLFNAKGCFACHSTDGTAKVGPSLKGAFGRTEDLSDGTKITVDNNYIRESLMEPQKKIVKGFPPSMPTFKGQLSDDEVNALIAFIKSLN